jgi:hypothetical protein
VQPCFILLAFLFKKSPATPNLNSTKEVIVLNILKLKNVVLVAAIAGALAACGGGGGRAAVSNGSTSGAFSGFVVDGYLSNALVTLDVNDNGICGDTIGGVADVSTRSDTTTGKFTFDASLGSHMICAKADSLGGIDLSTNAPFVGELKAPPAPAGTTPVITPLTSLVVAKMVADGTPVTAANTAAANTAAAAVANKLGLNTTNLLIADPVLLADTNPKLTQTTAAVQTLLLQAANVVAAASTGAVTAAQTAALYNSAVAGVAAAVAAQSTAVDMTTATGSLTTMVTAAISNTVTNVKNNPTAAATVVGIASLAPASVAAASAANVANVTQTVAVAPALALAAPPVGGVSVALSAQTNTLAVQTTALSKNSLTTAAASGTTTSAIAATAATATNALSNGDASGAAIAVNTLITAINVAAPTASIPTVTAPTLPTLTNVLVLSAPKANNVAVDSTTNSVTVTGPLTSAAMNVSVSGTPVLPSTSSAGFDVTEVGGSRALKLVIDQVVVTNNGGVITVTVPATAKLSAYGKNSAGYPYGAVLSNVASNVFASSSGVVSVNWSSALSALSGQPGFANLNLAKGTFNVTVVLSGVPLAKLSSASGAVPVSAATATVSIPISTVGVPNGAVAIGQGTTIQVVVN